MAANKWQQMLDDISSSSTGPFFFPKAGKTRIRLVPEGGEGENFFIETSSVRFGKTKTKYIILGQVMGTDKGELQEQWVNKVVPIVISKAALKQILGLLAEDYDLLSPTEGHGITLNRMGSGLDTTYAVLPSQKPIPLSGDVQPCKESLIELAEQYANRSDEEDEDASPKKKPKGVSTGEEW